MTTSVNTAAAIEHALQTTFQPRYLQLVNESMNHAGYFEGKQSHFKLTLVSDAFADQRLLVRHQQIYHALAEFLTKNGGEVHALAIHAYTPAEWQAISHVPDSPKCAGQRL